MHVFIDFEASSLQKHSFPVEVGWVLEDGTGEGHLIRPAPHWTDWDPEAEAIHGLSRERLAAEGTAHDIVCDRLVDLFAGSSVYCSAPSWDGHWLSMLLRASGRPRHLLRMRDTEELFAEAARHRLGPDASADAIVALVEEERDIAAALPVAHRAVVDARREWSVWRAIVTGARPDLGLFSS